MEIYHTLNRISFPNALKTALCGEPVGVALGPIYREDPAHELLAPFVRSAEQSGWRFDEHSGVPDWIIPKIAELRSSAIANRTISDEDLDDWGRAALVLKIATLRGIPVQGWKTLHPEWKMNATVTGRFGVESIRGAEWPKAFNAMTIPRDRRHLIVPSAPGRSIWTIDFKAMDVCSMVTIVPGVNIRYKGAQDMHERTAQLLFEKEIVTPEERETAKAEIWVHAYGGHSNLKHLFEKNIPELDWFRSLPHGEGARRIQSASARAFRAGLAFSLEFLTGETAMPMFVVHDELVLDVSDELSEIVNTIALRMRLGAERRMGKPYMTSVSRGATYADAKSPQVPGLRDTDETPGDLGVLP